MDFEGLRVGWVGQKAGDWRRDRVLELMNRFFGFYPVEPCLSESRILMARGIGCARARDRTESFCINTLELVALHFRYD